MPCSRWRLMLLMLLLMIGSVAAGSEESGPASAPSAGQGIILVLGDSLSAAYRIPEDAGWVALLEERIEARTLPWRVVNASVSGETTAGGLARLPALLDSHEPELVILQLGGNDGLRGLPVAHIRDNLEQMVALSQEAGARVLLIGIQIPPNYGPRYTGPFFAQYRQIAEQENVPLVPFLLEGVADDRELMQGDGIHPVAAAQPLILENVWPVLVRML